MFEVFSEYINLTTNFELLAIFNALPEGQKCHRCQKKYEYSQVCELKVRPTVNRDGNSSEIFTPRGIEEWQFTIPRGSRKKESIPWVPREFRGMGCYYILLIFQDLLAFLVLLSAL
jgi:hypothetical protein